MSNLVPGKKSPRKQSRFQKRWKQVSRLKEENQQFGDQLDALVNRIEETIHPVERDAALVDKQLLLKLFTLGRRKSLAKWKRDVLDDWIRELISEMQCCGHMDHVCT